LPDQVKNLNNRGCDSRYPEAKQPPVPSSVLLPYSYLLTISTLCSDMGGKKTW